MEKLESDYNIFDWWKKVFINNYANFSGRARRLEFWYFHLFNFILGCCVSAVTIPITVRISPGSSEIVSVFLAVFYLSLVIPSLAVIVRRLHDLNKSGANFFFYFIPLVGPIMMLVWMFTDGNRFTNNYGADSNNLYEEPEFDFEKTT